MDKYLIFLKQLLNRKVISKKTYNIAIKKYKEKQI